LLQPFKVLIFDVGKSASQILLMLRGKLKVLNKGLDTLKASKYDILTLKRVLSKKDIKCGGLFMLILLEIPI
jgi:hypothetical protein